MEENQIIKTVGENGEEVFMKLQEIVNVEGKDYALLSVVDDDVLPNSENDEGDELIIMRMNKTENECTFEIIEDDEEFNFVASAITDDDVDDDDILAEEEDY